ncbi:DUF2793 domain-containing protein [Altererythrobacter aquiaggeris]|uniref:DUF2793 domain-containing protein n=1 Tax=Aestuarierythrobacter aquiaggeris TaxID=1898396 RepID=UPI00301B348A
MTEPTTFPSQSGRFGLPFLLVGQAQKEFFYNESIGKLDCLLHASVKGDQSGPPQNPVDGDCWIIASPAAGEWAGNDGMLAGWNGGKWFICAPTSGMRVFNQQDDCYWFYRDAWQRCEVPAQPVAGNVIDEEARASIFNLVAILRVAGVLPAQ